MSDHPITTLPAAMLRPLPAGHRIALWRWILLPGPSYMLRRNGGVWVSGTLELIPDALRFVPGKPSSRQPAATLTIPLAPDLVVETRRGVASDRLIVQSGDAERTFMTVRGAEFVARLRSAIAALPSP